MLSAGAPFDRSLHRQPVHPYGDHDVPVDTPPRGAALGRSMWEHSHDGSPSRPPWRTGQGAVRRRQRRPVPQRQRAASGDDGRRCRRSAGPVPLALLPALVERVCSVNGVLDVTVNGMPYAAPIDGDGAVSDASTVTRPLVDWFDGRAGGDRRRTSVGGRRRRRRVAATVAPGRARGTLHRWAVPSLSSPRWPHAACLRCRRRAAVLVYGLGVTAMLATSGALPPRRLAHRERAVLQRLDHSMILVGIAGTYTAGDRPRPRRRHPGGPVVVAWALAIVGVVVRMRWMHAPSGLVAWSTS